jgi:hypothetical protein
MKEEPKHKPTMTELRRDCRDAEGTFRKFLMRATGRTILPRTSYRKRKETKGE